MTWNINVEVSIPPRERGSEKFASQLKSEAAALKSSPVYSFPSAALMLRYVDQIDNAVQAAIGLFESMETEFPTGCKVLLWLDGHVEEEILNYSPRHTGIRLIVQPVPHHR